MNSLLFLFHENKRLSAFCLSLVLVVVSVFTFSTHAAKQVSVMVKYDNGTGWQDTITSPSPGDVVNVLITVANSGSGTDALDNILVQDTLPAFTQYKAGTAKKWEF